MNLLFETNPFVNAAFYTKVNDISKKLGINPNWLLWVMNNESGLNPQAQNKKFLVHGQPATGLIQFIDTTATGLGTSIPALLKMNSVDQLDYVYKYFKPYTGKIKSIFDLYLVTFFPVAIGKPDNWVFEAKNVARSAVAKSNPSFDINGDGKITIAEFKQAITKKIKPDQKKLIFTAANGILGFAFLVGLFFLGRAVMKKTP